MNTSASPPRITQLPNNQTTLLLPKTHLQYYQTHGLFEESLIEWSKQFCSQDKIVLDIGAHTGTYSIHLAPLSKSVLAFEPQRATYYALCGSVALSNLAHKIHCYPLALGDEPQCGKHRPLYVISEDGGGSSLLPPSPQQTGTYSTMEYVDTITLDKFMETQPEQAPIAFIKIDVEGNEIGVLRGAIQTLKANNYPPILFESNTPPPTPVFTFLTTTLPYIIHPIRKYSNMFLATHHIPHTPKK